MRKPGHSLDDLRTGVRRGGTGHEEPVERARECDRGLESECGDEAVDECDGDDDGDKVGRAMPPVGEVKCAS